VTAGPKQGKFFVLEGIDGSGTTTQLSRVQLALEARGVSVLATREPTKGPVGTFLRQAIERRLVDAAGQPLGLDWAALALLFAADRVDHVRREIDPALARGQTVVSDRYDLSSIIYQSATAGASAPPLEWLRQINRNATRPDLTIVFSISPDLAAERRRQRGAAEDLFETNDLQRRLAVLYGRAASLMPEDRIAFVDAALPIENVTTQIVSLLDSLA